MKVLPAATKVLLEAEESVEDVVVLVNIIHADGIIRLANAVINITSQGNLYVGFPFSIGFPQVSETNSRGQIQVVNVDVRIGQFLLSLRSPPRIEIIVVSSVDFNTYLVHLRGLWLRNIRGNPIQVSADITTWDMATEPWPSRRVVSSNYPAVFWP